MIKQTGLPGEEAVWRAAENVQLARSENTEQVKAMKGAEKQTLRPKFAVKVSSSYMTGLLNLGRRTSPSSQVQTFARINLKV